MFIQKFIAVANNDVMNTIVENLKDRIIMKFITGWKINPNVTNYGANNINTLLLEAIKANDYKEAVAILEKASALVKDQLVTHHLL
ncbi:hypothetical protein [Metasolibacillus sp.]|uniref:hypothetical protein n=1 Tax=Metasolibacillus sp. TaxID=2703680 RepID=UPI0025FF154E|nr:hypothetical protein [Metasolibacillus sp.]MCT6925208.1 hypothetical protein [Metasolibacillus sp.]MCT6941434.1 hypothetical protein [Metasolibacillus sp.]